MSEEVRWQIVPVIPTARMSKAGTAHVNDRTAMHSAWKDMLETAPQAPSDAAISAILCAIKDRNGLHFMRTWVTADLHSNGFGKNEEITEYGADQKIALVRESSLK